ncbi:MAG TPA: TIGR02996 domain-containing protein [Fimbriiglobus sp.]|nr:TIGR02996 domain-containing protein [Fimbriiglobus sp.]
MTTDETALLSAIRASPADDLPRLVYADRLEEQGRQERAEFIRMRNRFGERVLL